MLGGRFLIIVSGFGGEEPLMLQMDCAMYSYMIHGVIDQLASDSFINVDLLLGINIVLLFG